jgi:probable rRNA maturation factor
MPTPSTPPDGATPGGGAPVVDGPEVAHRDDRPEADRAAVPVDLAALADLLSGVLAAEGVPARAEASLQLVPGDRIAALKAEHLDGDGRPTDVLSFPIDGAGPDGPPADDEPWLVGDVVVCVEVAAAQAPGHAGTLDDELALLVVHGGLHLCGWDHDEPETRAAMWARERELLERAGRTPARDPWGPG